MTVDERRLAAYHEAGHALAVLMRGGGELRSVSISDTVHGAGLTLPQGHRWNLAFIAYAGPWAEARAQWPPNINLPEFTTKAPRPTTGSWARSSIRPSDYEMVAAELASSHLSGATKQVWHAELEEVWPQIVDLSERVAREGTVDGLEVSLKYHEAEND